MMMKLINTRLGMAFLAAATAFNAQAASIGWLWYDQAQGRSLIQYMGFDSGDTQVHLVMVTPDLGDLIGALNDKTFNPDNFTDILGSWDGAEVEQFSRLESQNNDNLTAGTSYDVFLLVLNGDDIPNGDYNYFSFDYRLGSVPGFSSAKTWVFFGDSPAVPGGIDNFEPNTAPIPEPTTGILAVIGAASLLLRRRRRE